MSAYQLQQFLFDQLGRWAVDADSRLDPDGYELAPAEAAAVADNDIAALHQLGVHPVLLNAWCRATGYSRDEYRRLLAPYRRPGGARAPRWER